jgi:hypothetical protein
LMNKKDYENGDTMQRLLNEVYQVSIKLQLT